MIRVRRGYRRRLEQSSHTYLAANAIGSAALTATAAAGRE
jgi:hypothetical protein